MLYVDIFIFFLCYNHNVRARVVIEKHFGAVTALRSMPTGFSMSMKSQKANDVGGLGGGPASPPVFVSCGRDSMLHMWTSSGECLQTIAAHRGNIHSLSPIFSCGLTANSRNVGTSSATSLMAANNNLYPAMLTSGSDGMIKLWNMKRLKQVREVALGSSVGTPGQVNPLTGSVDGRSSYVKHSQSAQGQHAVRAVWTSNGIVSANINTGSVLLWQQQSQKNSSGRGLDTAGANKWVSQDIGSASASSTPFLSCSDIIYTPHFAACASKNGELIRWRKR